MVAHGRMAVCLEPRRGAVVSRFTPLDRRDESFLSCLSPVCVCLWWWCVRMIAGYEIDLNNSNTQDFFVTFRGPKESKLSRPSHHTEREAEVGSCHVSFVCAWNVSSAAYEGGIWKVHVELPDQYPFASPSIGFVNKILHPNVDEAYAHTPTPTQSLHTGWCALCWPVVDLQVRVRVSGRHQPDLDTTIQSVNTQHQLHRSDLICDGSCVCVCLHITSLSLFVGLVNIFDVFLPQLLTYPNPTDPLNSEAASLYMRDKKKYEDKVRGTVRTTRHYQSHTDTRSSVPFFGWPLKSTFASMPASARGRVLHPGRAHPRPRQCRRPPTATPREHTTAPVGPHLVRPRTAMVTRPWVGREGEWAAGAGEAMTTMRTTP